MVNDTNYRVILVPEGIAGMRADAGLAQVLGLPRSRIAHLVDNGSVLIKSRPVNKSTRLLLGDLVEIALSETCNEPEIIAEPVPGMNIIYHDDDIAVVDKPAGVASHPSLGWTGLTVLGGLKSAGFHITNFGPTERRGIVHRLDAGTSGVMVVALSGKAYSFLKRAFKNRQVHKKYHALVQGHLDPASGTIDAPISRAKGNDWRFAVRRGGKDSITHYDTIEAFRGASLLDIHLETGRTHQIRVHFSALCHPCVGDPTYGSDPKLSQQLGLDRQWLHARSLRFTHPSAVKEVEFFSEYPDDLAQALQILRG